MKTSTENIGIQFFLLVFVLASPPRFLMLGSGTKTTWLGLGKHYGFWLENVLS